MNNMDKIIKTELNYNPTVDIDFEGCAFGVQSLSWDVDMPPVLEVEAEIDGEVESYTYDEQNGWKDFDFRSTDEEVEEFLRENTCFGGDVLSAEIDAIVSAIKKYLGDENRVCWQPGNFSNNGKFVICKAADHPDLDDADLEMMAHHLNGSYDGEYACQDFLEVVDETADND